MIGETESTLFIKSLCNHSNKEVQFHTINGNYLQREGGLQIEIGGIDETIPEYDYVDVGGQVILKDYSGNELSNLVLILIRDQFNEFKLNLIP